MYSVICETVVALDSKAVTAKSLSSEVTVELNPPLIDKNVDYKLALISSHVWYSWYNITTENNLFRY